jgi:hypothetical protein
MVVPHYWNRRYCRFHFLSYHGRHAGVIYDEKLNVQS